ncbi:hypothetical protein FOIG_01107 [Fusarium odoratissimum NRRL 54006]|uniref:Uncharacterized protein n=2 Tax=Fusarium oxysporum species complex TaxID=171631 RepID=X0KCV8_FUSO5|nr:uncharacterized protein FOIG_01107 [Fusarium odoratissimum NRRL 54006]EXM11434.1 hypothetical protein FOIG_01107 [Fusarium odoratissimum NRRL 54006]TXC03573.1 hypothetical protein FocTR4_00001048 [Fusarium oxysporum f. sp. cubense]
MGSVFHCLLGLVLGSEEDIFLNDAAMDETSLCDVSGPCAYWGEGLSEEMMFNHDLLATLVRSASTAERCSRAPLSILLIWKQYSTAGGHHLQVSFRVDFLVCGVRDASKCSRR